MKKNKIELLPYGGSLYVVRRRPDGSFVVLGLTAPKNTRYNLFGMLYHKEKAPHGANKKYVWTRAIAHEEHVLHTKQGEIIYKQGR